MYYVVHICDFGMLRVKVLIRYLFNMIPILWQKLCLTEPFFLWAAFMLIYAKAESAFWNADSKRRSNTPLIQAIVRAQVNRKGVYMTSFKRGYNVILRSCFHQNQRFALTTIVNRTFLGCVHAYFAKAFWNADSKRRSKTPFTEVLFMLPSRSNDDYVYRRRHVSEVLGMFNSGYCSSSSEPERRLYDVNLNVVIMWFCVHASTRISVLL